MEEDIEILERVCSCRKFDGIFTSNEVIFQAIEHLIARNREIEEYANWHIEHLSEDIADYIDDDKNKNASLIGELKEEREHWKDIKRILKNKKTYIDYKNF